MLSLLLLLCLSMSAHHIITIAKKKNLFQDEDALIRRCVEECGGHADGSKEAKEMWTSLAAGSECFD